MVITSCAIAAVPTTKRPQVSSSSISTPTTSKKGVSKDLPQPDFDVEQLFSSEEEPIGSPLRNVTQRPQGTKGKRRKHQNKNSSLKKAIKEAARKGIEAMVDLYDHVEPTMKRKGEVLSADDPAAQLAMFSAPHFPEEADKGSRAAYAALYAAKKLKER